MCRIISALIISAWLWIPYSIFLCLQDNISRLCTWCSCACRTISAWLCTPRSYIWLAISAWQ
jgi:hypothetical protein